MHPGGRPRRRAARIVGALGLVCALGALALGLVYWTMTRRAMAADRERAHAEAVRAAAVIDGELARLPRVIDGLAADLSAGRLARDRMGDRMNAAMDTLPELFGVGAAYLPYAYDPDLRLYAPYYRRIPGDGAELIALDSLYDYTQAGQEWYEAPLKSGQRSWSEPAVNGATGNAVVEYSAPFSDAGGRTVGVVHGTMSLAEIDDLIRSLDLGEFGYGFLVSQKGFVVSHPFAAELVPSAAGQTPDAGSSRSRVRDLIDAIRSGRAGRVIDAIDPVTGKPSLILTERVPTTGWTVGVVFLKEASANGQLFRRVEMRFTVALLISACLLLTAAVLHRYDGSLKRLWAGVVAGCALLLVGIGVLWFEGYGAPAAVPAGDTAFVNAASVRRFVIDTTRASLKQSGTLPIFVPTGVLLQTFEVAGPNNINVTGVIWQKYAANVPASIDRGITLPESSDRTITEAYRRKTGDTEVIGWRFKATIRQSFDYSKYPLDQQTFRLRIRPVDLDRPVVLVPDLDSYQIIHPLARPGIDKNFTNPGWNIERTQFSADASDRSTSYGLAAADREDVHELTYNLVLNRQILEPVFSSLLPLAVSGFMVFSLLLLVKESTKTNVVQILSAYSGLFFVVILSELDMRRRLSSSSIMYIEYFYFVMYGAILTVALITLTNAYSGYFPRIERREHLAPKLLFWPTILATLLVVTLAVFY